MSSGSVESPDTLKDFDESTLEEGKREYQKPVDRLQVWKSALFNQWENVKALSLIEDNSDTISEDSMVTFVNMEASFQTYMARQSLRFLLGYMAVQLVYLVCFFVAAVLHKLNYVPLVADCIMLLLHISVAASHIYKRRHRRTIGNLSAPRLMLDGALMIDSVLFALSDPVVEFQANRILHVAELFDVLGGIPTLDGPVLHHPYKSNSVFQFHVMYMTLFVLSFESAVVITPLCLVIYSLLVLASYRSYYTASDSALEVVWEDVFTDIVVMLLTLFCMILAKRMLQKLQRSFFLALRAEKKKALEEKVRRCKVEFQNANLQDLLTDAGKACMRMASNPSARRHGQCRKIAASVKSAPAAVPPKSLSRCDGKASKEGDCSNTCDENGDCLPSTALVWVDGHMEPQALHLVRPGDRILCYDNLLRSVKHAEVVEVNMVQASDPKAYVEVYLDDGTQLEMTMDHRVERYNPEGGAGKFVPAAELRPGEDSLMVLKMTPQVVNRVVPSIPTAADENRRWVSLNVQQPQRHQVFVAQHHQGRDQWFYPQTMAVGSGDLQPTNSGIKRTFVHVPDTEQSSSRKTNSAPPTYNEYPGCKPAISPAMSHQISALATESSATVVPEVVLEDQPSVIFDLSALGRQFDFPGHHLRRQEFELDSECGWSDRSSTIFSSCTSAYGNQPSRSWNRRQRQRQRRREFVEKKSDFMSDSAV